MNQFWPVLDILSEPILISRRVIIAVSGVHILAKIANPLLPVLDKLDKRVHVSSAVFAPDNRLAAKLSQLDGLAAGKFAVRLDEDSDGDSNFFGQLPR